MSKPVIEDFATILTKENMGPLFDTVWDALEAANSPETARDALSVYSKDETYTQDETDALVTSKVERDGDTMLGPLTLQAVDPALDNHAARKAYVDRRVDEVTNTSEFTASGWWKDEKTGFILQWGASNGGASPVTVTFPIAFPVYCLSVVLCSIYPWDTATTLSQVGLTYLLERSLTGFRSINTLGAVGSVQGLGGGHGFMYLAVGK